MEGPFETHDLKETALTLGFHSAGVCDAIAPPHLEAYRRWIQRGHHGSMAYLQEHLPLKESPQTLLPGTQSIVAVALNYNQPNPVREGEPRIARYALGRDYHRVLRSKLKRLASWIEEAYPGTQTRACVDSAPILEREYANLAGLGFFGKNTMLIDPKRGSWFFLGLLLTTVRFTPDAPFVGGCGECTRCIDACPTGAILNLEGTWQVDARKCISYLTIEHRGQIEPELQPHMGSWTFGCDICQEVCPFNEERASQPLRATQTQEEGFLAARKWPTLSEMASLGEDGWDALTQGSAVRRTGREGLARNAAINLENSRSTSGTD